MIFLKDDSDKLFIIIIYIILRFLKYVKLLFS